MEPFFCDNHFQNNFNKLVYYGTYVSVTCWNFEAWYVTSTDKYFANNIVETFFKKEKKLEHASKKKTAHTKTKEKT